MQRKLKKKKKKIKSFLIAVNYLMVVIKVKLHISSNLL